MLFDVAVVVVVLIFLLSRSSLVLCNNCDVNLCISLNKLLSIFPTLSLMPLLSPNNKSFCNCFNRFIFSASAEFELLSHYLKRKQQELRDRICD